MEAGEGDRSILASSLEADRCCGARRRLRSQSSRREAVVNVATGMVTVSIGLPRQLAGDRYHPAQHPETGGVERCGFAVECGRKTFEPGRPVDPVPG